MYQHFFKRILDIFSSGLAIIVLFPILVILTFVGAVAMKGNPFFLQPRPGKDEKIFHIVKFRTMTNEKDKGGNLLPDEKRLNAYGKFIRSTSLDELAELWNILNGDMSVVGPRPQLVRDMVFMTAEQRKRHTVRPGLTGLAQISGRNGISWEEKLSFDLQYLEDVTFWNDVKIIVKTALKVLQREGISAEGMDTAMDLGDCLLMNKQITEVEYTSGLAKAERLLAGGM